MDRPRTRGGRAARTALLAITAAAACAGLAGPTQAATGTHTVTVLPDSSTIELSTFPGRADLQVEVLRAGVQIAKASVTTDAAGDADVNGGGASCWSDATPDILPGDVVQVSGQGFVDTNIVDDVAACQHGPAATGPALLHPPAQAP